MADHVSEALKQLNQAGLSANGFLFNGVPLRGRQYGYGYGYERDGKGQGGVRPALEEKQA